MPRSELPLITASLTTLVYPQVSTHKLAYIASNDGNPLLPGQKTDKNIHRMLDMGMKCYPAETRSFLGMKMLKLLAVCVNSILDMLIS